VHDPITTWQRRPVHLYGVAIFYAPFPQRLPSYLSPIEEKTVGQKNLIAYPQDSKQSGYGGEQ
jgi:hypothetical protein